MDYKISIYNKELTLTFKDDYLPYDLYYNPLEDDKTHKVSLMDVDIYTAEQL